MSWKNKWFDPQKAHHTPFGFCNPEGDLRKPGALQRWRKERKAAGLPPPPAQGYPAFITRWWQRADVGGDEDAVWWLGHACLLFRLAGRYCLIDPALSQRASPLRFYGPCRRTPAPLQVETLPRLDVLLISHNHYDHLDRPTIKKILRRFPQVEIIVPLGLEPWFRRVGAKRVTPLDWWQEKNCSGMAICAVPARHWSRRTLYDRNRSLWCGWVIRTETLRFWFTGDSGWSPALLDIHRRLGPFTLAALPIGAYKPQWFMQAQHMSPEQAVLLWREIGCPRVIPIHWGVWELADEALDEPPWELARALQQAGLASADFQPFKIGERLELKAIYDAFHPAEAK